MRLQNILEKGQMGRSAVPVKRNPIKSEKVSSLARLLRSLIGVALENIPLWHERDLSNSANERFTIPTAAILLDANVEFINKCHRRTKNKYPASHLELGYDERSD